MLKKFKKIVHAASSFQCKFCSQCFGRDAILDHVKICQEQAADRSRQSVLLPPLYGVAASSPGNRISVLGPSQSFSSHLIQVTECKLEDGKVMCHLVVTVDDEERPFSKSL